MEAFAQLTDSEMRNDFIQNISSLLMPEMDSKERARVMEAFAQLTDSEMRNDFIQNIKSLITPDIDSGARARVTEAFAQLTDSEMRSDFIQNINSLITPKMDSEARARVMEAFAQLKDRDVRQEFIHNINSLITPDIDSGERARVMEAFAQLTDPKVRQEFIQDLKSLIGPEMNSGVQDRIIGVFAQLREPEVRQEFINNIKSLTHLDPTMNPEDEIKIIEFHAKNQIHIMKYALEEGFFRSSASTNNMGKLLNNLRLLNDIKDKEVIHCLVKSIKDINSKTTLIPLHSIIQILIDKKDPLKWTESILSFLGLYPELTQDKADILIRIVQDLNEYDINDLKGMLEGLDLDIFIKATDALCKIKDSKKRIFIGDKFRMFWELHQKKVGSGNEQENNLMKIITPFLCQERNIPAFIEILQSAHPEVQD
jgi:hypothetical protein